MKVLYACSGCSQRKNAELESKYNITSGWAIKKYHLLLMRGMAENGAEVQCISGLSLNRASVPDTLIRGGEEREDGVDYRYLTTLNLPVMRQLMIFLGTFFRVLRAKKDADTCAVFDCLTIASAIGTALACKLRRIPTAAIVTDIPQIQHSNRLVRTVNMRLLGMADGFILLTEQMNERVNRRGRPHIVLEGHVDSNVPEPSEQGCEELISGRHIALYAGSIKAIYGIKDLVRGFIEADIPDSELHVYGTGDFTDELNELAREHPKLKYCGTAPNEEIVRQEQRASLLIDPRPTAPEYTKYSFPSKNMEYMASGTPLLTTRLPGMPEEYLPYVSLIEDESPSGIARALAKFFELPFGQRRRMGLDARRFVLENKSNIVQSKRILDFLTEMSRDR